VPMIELINPETKNSLFQKDNGLIDSDNSFFPIINKIPRFVNSENYCDNFGFQWKKFSKTQLDNKNNNLGISKERFFSETNWNDENLSNQNILEVGSGAGRFSEVILTHTRANLYSVDFSNAVDSNFKNNGHIAPSRFYLFQASIYELPFNDNSFDKVFCLGVLQHTPNFEKSIESLISKVKIGGEVVVDFYPINGWWTKLNAKYMLRPFTKKISHDKLISLIETHVDWLIKTHLFFNKIKLGFLNRFLPIVDIEHVVPKKMNYEKMREWVVLDTFDMLSPEFDNPQKISSVKQMFEKNGVSVDFAGYVYYGKNSKAATVRGIKST
jgi:SAM-dependent methyltransferase